MHDLITPQDPHRRRNPLTGEWVLVSPHRTKRPWQGQIEKSAAGELPPHDPSCYLCPGGKRASGDINPNYTGTFVFTNDFSALLPDTASVLSENPLFSVQSEKGLCRVVCFSPRHDLTLAKMDTSAVKVVVDTLVSEFRSMAALDYINHVQIFENRGEMMGCSNPHPHCQIWAEERTPEYPAREEKKQREYMGSRGSCLLCDYLDKEETLKERTLFSNSSFTALTPFWAVWPFETMIIPRFHAADFTGLSEQQRTDLADILRRMTVRFDNLFNTDFPYSMGIHQAPCDGKEYPHWHFHIHFYPPLLRSAAIRKFMVGYELLAMPQRDITPEQSAERLKGLSETHYSINSPGAEPADRRKNP